MTKTQKIVYYVLLVLISALFIFAAIPKLMGQAIEVSAFASVGLPVWFMYIIGIGEIAGTIGLWIRGLSFYAAEGLFLVLAGAFGTTLAVQGAVLALLPLVAGIILGIVVWLGRKRGFFL